MLRGAARGRVTAKPGSFPGRPTDSAAVTYWIGAWNVLWRPVGSDPKLGHLSQSRNGRAGSRDVSSEMQNPLLDRDIADRLVPGIVALDERDSLELMLCHALET